MAKTKTKSSFAFRICVALFAVYAVVSLVKSQVEIAAMEQQVLDITQACEDQRIANKDIERLIVMGEDEEYVERIAREKLDYGYPNEHVYVDVSGN